MAAKNIKFYEGYTLGHHLTSYEYRQCETNKQTNKQTKH